METVRSNDRKDGINLLELNILIESFRASGDTEIVEFYEGRKAELLKILKSDIIKENDRIIERMANPKPAGIVCREDLETLERFAPGDNIKPLIKKRTVKND